MKRPALKTLLTWLLLAGITPVYATADVPVASAADCQPVDSDALAASSAPLLIGQINVRAADLFDLTSNGQNGFVHAAVNGLHIVTQERTILSVLPFKGGDAYSAELLVEAERLLRSRRYLHDATVRPVQRCGDAVDIEVYTIDNWTLTPSVSFGTAGGQTHYSVELQDLNLLGLGKTIKLKAEQDGDQAQSTFLYGDENLFGTHLQAFVELDDSDVGEKYAFSTGLPFYSQTAMHSWWLKGAHDSERVTSRRAELAQSDTAGVTADAASTLLVGTDRLDLGASRRMRASDSVTASIGAGIRLDRQQSDDVGAQVDTDWLHDHDERYPYLTMSWSSLRWDERHNFNALRKTEDVRTGTSAKLEFGLLLEAFGNARDAIRLDLELARSWYSGRDTLESLTFGHTQYFDADDLSQRALQARYGFFHWLTPDDQIDFRLSGQLQRGYSPKYDVRIGGADGLKAYPTDFQLGDRRWVAMGEYRHVNRWSPLGLVNTAFTAFAEAGQAWYDGDDKTVLADVGVGVLLTPTRGTRGALTRFDIAVPLTERDDVGSYQMFIGTQINY